MKCVTVSTLISGQYRHIIPTLFTSSIIVCTALIRLSCSQGRGDELQEDYTRIHVRKPVLRCVLMVTLTEWRPDDRKKKYAD